MPGEERGKSKRRHERPLGKRVVNRQRSLFEKGRDQVLEKLGRNKSRKKMRKRRDLNAEGGGGAGLLGLPREGMREKKWGTLPLQPCMKRGWKGIPKKKETLGGEEGGDTAERFSCCAREKMGCQRIKKEKWNSRNEPVSYGEKGAWKNISGSKKKP